MARYSVGTKMKREQIIQAAVEFFGPAGLGLAVAQQDSCCAGFEGSGGHVSVEIDETEAKTEVTIETREWDYQVRQFMGKVT